MAGAIAPADASPATMVSPELHRRIVNKVRATAVRHLLDQVKMQFAPHLAVALFIAWLVWDHAGRLHLLLWLGSYLGLVYTAEAGAWIYARRHPVRDDQIEAWERFWLALKSTNSLYVGYAYYAFGLGGPREDLFTLLMAGIMYTAAQYSRGDMKMATGMVIPVYAGVLAAHLSRATERDFVYAGMFTLAFGSAFSLVLQQSKQAFEAFYARFLKEELAAVLQRKHDELARAKLEVDVASQAKSRFFAVASHDLRQPLHALSLLLGSLQHKVKQQNVLPVLQQMEAAIGSLESLFRDVLDVARLESGKTDVRIAAVPSQRLFQRLQREFEAIAGAKGLELRFCGPHVLLQTDEMLLKRILANLISNAIKYTDRGGALVACRRSKREGMVSLQVFDTGTGIAPTEIDHIFEDFYQASLPEGARRRQREGVGLGLGIVKRLADLLHHPVEVRSRPGRGSLFELRVPISREAAAVPEGPEDTEAIASLSFAGRSILVVDDEEVVVDAIAGLLSDWDAKVLTATSRAQLQDLLGTLSVAPDFLIVDYQFEPAWTGEDAILAVRESFGCAVPAAIMTGNVALVPERVARSGGVHVFAKPVSPAKLRALLRFSLAASPGSGPRCA